MEMKNVIGLGSHSYDLKATFIVFCHMHFSMLVRCHWVVGEEGA